jgi:trehalose utilization protein
MHQMQNLICFVLRTICGFGTILLAGSFARPIVSQEPIRILVWDEQQPSQKEAYENFLGNQIAKHLQSKPGLQVRTASIDDGEQGLSPALLDFAQVIVWWGHVRHPEIKSELGLDIVRRVRSGQCNLVALHSAHWSTPFMEAMNEITRVQLREELRKQGIENANIVEIPADRFKAPARDAKITPYWEFESVSSDESKRQRSLKLHLPNCCFPAYRNDGQPSFLQVLKPEHPLAKDLPKTFSLPRTEMYDEPFHVPAPDEVILQERWKGGEEFRSVMLWKLGKGSIIYVRPGHETYPIYKDTNMLQLIENAVRYPNKG